MSDSFGEVITAMVTPFDENLNLNLDKARELASYLVDNGSDGILVLGTTGEVPTLTKEEKILLLETVVDEVGDKTKILAGTGSYSTQESIEMTREAEKIGVDGILIVCPYYNKPPQEGLYRHFKMIAESTSLPIMIYNVPGRTSRNIEMKTICRLAEIENIIAVKEASGDISQITEICNSVNDDFYVYSGDDNMTLPALSVGGCGVVSVASHLVGNDIKEMIQNYKQGNVQKAISLNKKLSPFFKGIFLTTNPIPIKAALNLVGHNVGGLRPPLLELNHSEEEVLQGILQGVGLL